MYGIINFWHRFSLYTGFFLEAAFRQANGKLNLLSGIIRHDINNQLTVLQGYLEVLEDGKLYPSQNEYFQKASNAARRYLHHDPVHRGIRGDSGFF